MIQAARLEEIALEVDPTDPDVVRAWAATNGVALRSSGDAPADGDTAGTPSAEISTDAVIRSAARRALDALPKSGPLDAEALAAAEALYIALGKPDAATAARRAQEAARDGKTTITIRAAPRGP